MDEITLKELYRRWENKVGAKKAARKQVKFVRATMFKCGGQGRNGGDKGGRFGVATPLTELIPNVGIYGRD